MKHKYCLIRNDGDMGSRPFVYVVWVGSSLRESASLALVEEFCRDCGWYFKRWSPVVDSALDLRFRKMRVDGNVTAKPYQMITLNIQQCYQTIIDDSFAALEANYSMSQFELWQRFRNTIQYYTTMNRRIRNTSCPPSGSKYLSHKKWSDCKQAAVMATCIVILIMLDALVSSYLL